jgi:hypothetical protein
VVRKLAAHFPDNKTVLISQEDLLKKMLTEKESDSPLIDHLTHIEADYDLISIFDIASQREQIEGASKQITHETPPILAVMMAMSTKVNTVVLTAGLSKDYLLTSTLHMDDAEGAEQIGTTLISSLELGKQIAVPMLDSAQAPPEAVPMMVFAKETLAGMSVSFEKNKVVFVVKKLESFSKLAEFLPPAINAARSVAARSQQMNNLKRIGLAMHNYHDNHDSFPMAGADATGMHKGLSWRVHILPELKNIRLYRQFKLNEPWDSEHNKKLISKMPDIFKTSRIDKKGKTALHVFVGEGTPFGDNKAIRMKAHTLSELLEGVLDTFLVVQAGSDKADVWTKPGGIPFKEKDPISELGNIADDGFLALFLDGHVQTIAKDISAERLKRLIQHDDGKPVGGF